MTPPSPRLQRATANTAGMVSATAWVVGVILLLAAHAGHHRAFPEWFEATVNGLAFTAVGVILCRRRPDNVVSWLFMGLALLATLQLAFGQWATLAGARVLPAGQVMALLAELAPSVLFPLIGALLSFFPTGRVVNRRWTAYVLLLPVLAVVELASVLARPGPFEDFPRLVNPLGLDAGWAAGVYSAASSLGAFLVLPALGSLGQRWWRAQAGERQQLKPFFLATLSWIAIFGVSIVFSRQLPTWWAHVAFGLGVAGLAAAATVSVLRYRLYDIDRVVSRTVSYAVITGLLIAVYVGLVAGIQAVLPAQSSLAVAASTLTVAALFQPLRRRVQRAVDHRFNRARYDSERVVDGFAADLRQQIALDSVTGDLVGVVHRTVQPEFASVWVRP